jgi:hypothetical protein
MSSIRTVITASFLLVLSSLFFSGYKSASYQGKELLISVSLDSIKPGQITQKQLGSVKELVIKSNGTPCFAKSYEFLVIPKKGPSHLLKCSGNKLVNTTIQFFKDCKPGDLVLVSNLVLFGNVKYKPVSDLKWTVIADPK